MGLTPRLINSIGEYSDTRRYFLNDIVSWEGSLFKLIVNEAIQITPTDETYWQPVTGGSYSFESASKQEKYYIIGVPSLTSDVLYCATENAEGTENNAGVYFEGSSGVLYGAAWNDYAEYRETKTPISAGHVVIEQGDGSLALSTKRLQPGANIVSDTYGFIIGGTEKSKTPIAVSGRVLAYPNEKLNKYNPGDAVCSGPNGTVSKMSRREIKKWPERIIGIVSEIPTYSNWNGVSVNNRIWIQVK